MDKDPSWGIDVLRRELAVSLGNAFSGCAVGITIPQAPGNATALAAMDSFHTTSPISGTSTISVMQAADKHNAKLQAALDKHQDDFL
jgi:hypothetical protein